MNLNLRTGERVLLVVGEYEARDFDALFEGARALPWEDFIPRDGAFPIKGHSLSSQLHAVPACQAVLKKAAAARLGEKYGLAQLPENGALYQLQFSIMKDHVTLMVDTTGPGLHKRGYRAVGVAAPLRETLAAAMVLLSRYRGRDPFCDPFCGSGTIPIEAALIAKKPGAGTQPQLFRPAVAVAGQHPVAPGRRRGHGRGVPRQLRHLGRGTSTPGPWTSPAPTPRRRRWRMWCALT